MGSRAEFFAMLEARATLLAGQFASIAADTRELGQLTDEFDCTEGDEQLAKRLKALKGAASGLAGDMQSQRAGAFSGFRLHPTLFNHDAESAARQFVDGMDEIAGRGNWSIKAGERGLEPA